MIHAIARQRNDTPPPVGDWIRHDETAKEKMLSLTYCWLWDETTPRKKESVVTHFLFVSNIFLAVVLAENNATDSLSCV